MLVDVGKQRKEVGARGTQEERKRDGDEDADEGDECCEPGELPSVDGCPGEGTARRGGGIRKLGLRHGSRKGGGRHGRLEAAGADEGCGRCSAEGLQDRQQGAEKDKATDGATTARKGNRGTTGSDARPVWEISLATAAFW